MLKIVVYAILLIFALTAAFKLKSRIINGQSSERGQFPFYAFIGLIMNDTDVVKESEIMVRGCGGSILNERFILTAAHCMDGVYKLSIFLGSSTLDDINEESRIIFVVDKSNVHIHFEFEPINLHNDIALVQLDESIQFTNAIQPIKLATDHETDLIDRNLIAIGNGFVSETYKSAPVLKHTQLKIISLNECRRLLSFVGTRTTAFCAISLIGSSICHGDSGK